MAAQEPRAWLFKSEPEVFSVEDLAREKNQTTAWDGVRNYQARNFLRDEVKIGDGVLFYHSNAHPPAIVGIARVVGAARPDASAFETPPDHPHHDPKSRKDAPIWVEVLIRLEEVFAHPVTLPELRSEPAVADMELLRKGSRLSVQPVSAKAWNWILARGRRRSE